MRAISGSQRIGVGSQQRTAAPVAARDLALTDESNLATLFRKRSVSHAQAVRWRQGSAESLRTVTFQEQQRLVNQLMCGLDALGARPGDAIGILSGTRWEWIVSDWAIMGLGAVTTALNPSLTSDVVAFMLRDASVRFLFIEDETQYVKARDLLDQLPTPPRLIVFDESALTRADRRVISFAALLSLASQSPEAADQFAAVCAQRIQLNDRAALIYTSGTTGEPKGVILTHRALLAQVAGAGALLNTVHAGMVDALFLPLSHVLGRLEHLFTLERGAQTVILPSLDHLAQDIQNARPNILLSVPRVYEKAYAAVMERVHASSPVRRAVFHWARRVGLDAVRYQQTQRQKLPTVRRLRLALADRLVFRQIRAALGGRLQFAISGGAPLDPAIIEFFHAAGVPILEGWGLTETGGAFTVNQLDDCRIGSVGRPYPGHEIRIAPDDEILVRGPCLFNGYLNNPDATAEALDDEGWFHTGDLGTLDGDGFLTILDRKKELIVTSGGKKIAPQRVEGLLKEDPLVAQACVYGDREPYVVALLTLDWKEVARWADGQRQSYTDPHDLAGSPILRQRLDAHVAHVNERLARFEQVKRYDVLTDDFTVENGLLTPTQKIRRKGVNQRYQSRFEMLYNQAAPAKSG